jgi:hypothetical protein
LRGVTGRELGLEVGMKTDVITTSASQRTE